MQMYNEFNQVVQEVLEPYPAIVKPQILDKVISITEANYIKEVKVKSSCCSRCLCELVRSL